MNTETGEIKNVDSDFFRKEISERNNKSGKKQKWIPINIGDKIPWAGHIFKIVSINTDESTFTLKLDTESRGIQREGIGSMMSRLMDKHTRVK